VKTTRRQFLKWSGLSAATAVAFYGCGIPDEEIEVQSPVNLPEDLVSGLEGWYATRTNPDTASYGAEGIIVRVIEGRAIKIEGNPDHPISQGKSSVRCQAGLQALYNPDRLDTPKRRVGNRGDGQYESISWEDAIAELTRYVQNSGKRTLLATNLERGSLGVLANRFAKSQGGTYLSLEPIEQTVLRAVVKDVFDQDRIPVFDIANADHILNFGADFLGTWLSPVHYSRAYGEFRQGKEGIAPATRHRGTLTHVEPRMSITAANADNWVYVNPGYEGLLALSVAYVLFSEHPFRVDKNASSLDELSQFDPAKTATKTGVSVTTVRELAKELADHPKSLVIGGGSAAAHTNGFFNLKAIYTLNHVLGSVGSIGGIQFNPSSPIEMAPSDASSFGSWRKAVGEMNSGNVDLCIIRRANPVYSLPAALGFSEALEQVDKVVSFSSFMDETTNMADLILPEPTYLESWGDDVPDPGPGYQTVTLQQPVVNTFSGTDTRSFGDVLLEVSSRLGNVSNLPWRNVQDALRDRAWTLHDKSVGSVRGGTREEFWNAVLQRGGWWDMKTKEKTSSVPSVRLPDKAEEPDFGGVNGTDTFYLLPFSSLSIGEGQGANLPWLQATPDPITTAVWHTWAEINPERAETMSVREGDVLEIEGAEGRKITAIAYLNPAAHRDVLSVVLGQGHKIYGNFEIGDDLHKSLVGKQRGSNVLDVLSAKSVKIGGKDEVEAFAWAATRVKVSKTANWTRLSKLEGTVLPVELPGQPIVQTTRPDTH
jgi:anaerobic selenocysteine-containing dehydrogenase